MSRALPTAEHIRNIEAFVRAGAFKWVAAVASGVSKAKFAEWMRGTTPEELEFQYVINRAAAQARVGAEVAIYGEPGPKGKLAWLMRGPGREKPDEEGWTSQVAVTGRNGGALEQVVAQAEEDYSRLTTDEMRTLRALRDKAQGKDNEPQ
jgi:hypothetical protein